MAYTETFESIMGKTAIKKFCPMQVDDVLSTFSDVSQLKRDFNYFPETNLDDGIRKLVDSYKSYYRL